MSKWSNYIIYVWKLNGGHFNTLFRRGKYVEKIGKLLLFLPILFFLGCKTVQPTIITRDSVRIEYRLDSVYLYERDSVFVDRYVKGDTVFLTQEKFRVKYQDKTVQVHDTIYRDREQVIVQTEKVTPRWAWWSLIVCICFVALFIVRIIIKIYTRR